MKRALLTAGMALTLTGLLVSEAPARSAPSGTTVRTAFNAKLKKTIVVDGSGRTLYMFTADISGTPNCAALGADCPKLWPALTSAGPPRAGEGINASLLGITAGAGGVRQVTYNRHPLYYYRDDRKPGDVRGQGSFGAWFVLSPRGTRL